MHAGAVIVLFRYVTSGARQYIILFEQ